jgi:hypothetical protein
MVVLGGRYFLIIAVVVFAVWRGLCWRRHGIRGANELVVLVLFAWSVAVAYVALFPMHLILYAWHERFSLIPLSSSLDMIRFSTTQTVVKNLGGNILLFVPIGFLLPVLFERLRGVWSLAWRAAVLSAIIEIIQIPTQAHSTDVDDVILNVIGALLGLAVFRAGWALAGRWKLRDRLATRLSSRSRREPLLTALAPFAIILVLTSAVLVPKVVAGTLSRAAVARSIVGELPGASEVARTEVGGYLFAMARADDGGREVLRRTEFKKVLPGRFVLTAEGDEVRADASDYICSITAYDPTHGEKPVVYVEGCNEVGATSVTLNVRGRPSGRASVGRYFVAAFTLDDGDLDPRGHFDFEDLSITFTDSAGLDVTSRFARW